MTAELLNVEAEQALLGAVLVNNAVYDRVSSIVRGDDFGDPVHASIWRAVDARIRDGALASPVTLRQYFDEDPGIAVLGGVAYLARLAGAAISLFAAPDYARLIADMAQRRALAGVLAEAQAAIADPEQDVASILGRVEAHALMQETQGEGNVVTFAAAITAASGAANAANLSDTLTGTTTGIRALDDATGGLQAGDYVILGGRASMGKTAVALSIALGAARAGHGVLFASLEMSPEQLATRALSETSARSGNAIAYHDLMRGRFDGDDFLSLLRRQQEEISLPIAITPRSCRNVGAIASQARLAQRRLEAKGRKLGLVVIDYLQLLQPPQRRSNRQEEVSDISSAVKAMAGKLDVPVLALSQLSRGVEGREDKRPGLADLRESGSLEQDADVVIFAYREEYYLRRASPRDEDPPERHEKWHRALANCAGRVDLVIAKARMGEITTVKAMLDAATNWMRDVPLLQQAPPGLEDWRT